MNEAKRAVIYARFSSDNQREESIDAQVRACKAYCKGKGYLVTHIYRDEAKSGTKLAGRDAYNQMLADAKDDLFDVVIFHKVDRNARNEFDYYTTKRTLTQLGIKYEYAVQNIDNTPEGQMMESMLVGFAAYYSRNLAKETKKGLNENAYKAQFNGGTAPFGYKIIDKHYVIDEREAEGVRMIFRMYLDGKGYTEIARALAEKGYRTKSGKNFSKVSLHDILRNEKYIGIYTFNKVTKKSDGTRNSHGKPSEELIRVENAVPAIISKDDFIMVQKIKADNQKHAARFRASVPYLLTGKIFCEHCGSAMNGHRMRRNEKEYSYYACNRKERVAGETCPNKYINSEALERWVIDSIKQCVFTPQNMANIAKEMANQYADHTKNSKNRLIQLKRQKAALEKRMGGLYDIMELNGVDDYNLDRLKAVKAQIDDIENEMASCRADENAPTLTAEQIEATLKALQEKLGTGDEIARRFLINTFVDKIVVGEKNISMRLSMENILDSFGQTVNERLVPRTRSIRLVEIVCTTNCSTLRLAG